MSAPTSSATAKRCGVAPTTFKDRRPTSVGEVERRLAAENIDVTRVDALLPPIDSEGPCEALFWDGTRRRRAEFHLDGRLICQGGW